MEFKEVYTRFNDFYYSRLNDMVRYANSNSNYARFFQKINEKGIDLDKVLYEKLLDEYEETTIDSQKYGLLPLGLRNSNVPHIFIDQGERAMAGRYGNLNTFNALFLEKISFRPIYHHTTDSLKQTFRRLCDSYIEHYKESLNEIWSEADFYARLSDLKYLSVKYAVDLETGEVFAVGFFGTLIKSGAGGKTLTDAELYVMPEFRKMGIAKKMVGLTFELARDDGVENFDSITYRVQSCDALSFWQKIGALVTGLTHIEGSISDMIETIDKSCKSNRSF